MPKPLREQYKSAAEHLISGAVHSLLEGTVSGISKAKRNAEAVRAISPKKAREIKQVARKTVTSPTVTEADKFAKSLCKYVRTPFTSDVLTEIETAIFRLSQLIFAYNPPANLRVDPQRELTIRSGVPLSVNITYSGPGGFSMFGLLEKSFSFSKGDVLPNGGSDGNSWGGPGPNIIGMIIMRPPETSSRKYNASFTEWTNRMESSAKGIDFPILLVSSDKTNYRLINKQEK